MILEAVVVESKRGYLMVAGHTLTHQLYMQVPDIPPNIYIAILSKGNASHHTSVIRNLFLPQVC